MGGDDGGLVCCRAALGKVMVVADRPDASHGTRTRVVVVICMAHLHGASAWHVCTAHRSALHRLVGLLVPHCRA